MRLTVQPTFLPTTAQGSCYLCKLSPRKDRAGARELVIDTGVTIDFEGVVGICSTCVVEMAGMLGMVAASELEELKASHAADLHQADETAAQALADLEAAEARAQEAEQAFALAARLKEQPAPKAATKPRAPKALAEAAPA